MTEPRRARVLLVDDHPMVCEGMRGVLTPRFDVVGAVHDGREVGEAVRKHRPDLVLLDLGLPGRSVVEVLREIRRSLVEAISHTSRGTRSEYTSSSAANPSSREK